MDPLHVQLVAEVSVELPLIVFSVVVLTCIVRKFQSGAHGFATDFFLFYIVQSLLDVFDYFVYLIYYRLTRDGLLPFFAGFPWVNIFHCTHIYLAYVQRTMHAAIAYNRFTALSSTSFSPYAALNKYHKAKRILVAAFLVPLFSITPGLLSRMEFVPSPTPPMLRMTSSTTWSSTAFSTSGMVITVLTTSACVYFDIRAFMTYRTLSNYRQRTLRHEIHLFGRAILRWIRLTLRDLAFTVLQTAVQFLMCAISTVLVIGTFTNNIPLIVLVLKYYPAISDVYSFSSPIFLFATSKNVRRALLPNWRIRIATVSDDSSNRLGAVSSRFTM